MSNFRLLSILRSSLFAGKYFRITRSISVLSIDVQRSVIVKPERIRLFSSSTVYYARRQDKISSTIEEDLDDEDENEEGDDEDSIQTEEEKIRNNIQQYKLPKGYRIIIKHLASLRLDLICSAGTGLGRSTIEDEFYGSKLRINGEKSGKKAQQVKEGDVIDLVLSRIEGAKYKSKRIILYKVFEEKSLKNKVKVCLIAWRQGIEVDGSQWS